MMAEIMRVILGGYVNQGRRRASTVVHFYKTAPNFFITLCLAWTKETAKLF